MGKGLPLIIIILLIVGIVAFLYLNNNTNNTRQNQMPPDEPDQSSSELDLEEVTPEGYERYGVREFSILYHEDMGLPRNQEGAPGDPVSFVLTGPTQEENTELYDGINITVSHGNYEVESFEDFVASEMEEIENDGVSEITSEMTDVVIGDNSGYEFTTQGLGEFRQIYFEKSNNQYVHVSVFVEDPEDQGYQAIVDQMLQSLSF